MAKSQGQTYTALERKAAKASYIEALVASFGIATTAQKKTGIDDHTIRDWRRKDAAFDAAVREASGHGEERLLDIAEHGLAKKIADGDLKAIRYYLGTKGRKRGYDSHQTIDVNEVHRPSVAFEEDADDAL